MSNVNLPASRRVRRWSILAIVTAIVAVGAVASGQEVWTLITADFHAQPAALASIDEAGVHLAGGDGGAASGRLVAPGQFLMLERTGSSVAAASAAPGAGTASAAAGASYVLHLLGGQQLVGTPGSMTADAIVWKNAAIGELAVPMSSVSAITRPGGTPAAKRPTEDVVTLANGDVVRGIVTGLSAASIDIKPPDADVATPIVLSSVAHVQLAAIPGGVPRGGGGASGGAPVYRFRLEDGSMLDVAGLRLGGETVSFRLDGEPAGDANAARTLPLARVLSIEHVNGPARWLSSVAPLASEYVPLLGAEQNFPARMDQTVEGSSDLRFAGRTFRRAIGVHSFSRVTFPIDAGFVAFRTQYAIAEDRVHADVTVRIKLDDALAHEQANVRAGTLSPVVLIDLNGAKTLTLEVDYGEGLHVDDHLTWLEPALLRTKPAPPQLQTPPPQTPPPQTRPATAPAVRPATR